MDGTHLQGEALHVMTLPVQNGNDIEYFLPPEEAKKCIDTNGLSLKDLINVPPNPNHDDREYKTIADASKIIICL